MRKTKATGTVEFNPAKHYLGSLCKRGHAHPEHRHYSIRRKSGGACVICDRLHAHDWAIDHPESRQTITKRYKDRHPDAHKLAYEKQKEKDPEELKRKKQLYYQKNKERIAAQQAKYRAENPDKVSQARHKWYVKANKKQNPDQWLKDCRHEGGEAIAPAMSCG